MGILIAQFSILTVEGALPSHIERPRSIKGSLEIPLLAVLIFIYSSEKMGQSQGPECEQEIRLSGWWAIAGMCTVLLE